MRLNRYIAALATTTALVGAGIAIPQAQAQNEAAVTDPGAPVEGLSWTDVEAVAGGEVTLNPQGTVAENIRVVGPASGNGFTFESDQQTGVIKVKTPINARPGQEFDLPIRVHKWNTTAKDWDLVGEYTTKLTIVAGGNNHANRYQVNYADVVVKERSEATTNRTVAVPQGTTFAVVGQPDGYSVSVNADGNVTVKPASNVGAGSKATARIKITYPDTSYEYSDVKITVSDETGNTTPHKDRDNAKFEPAWDEGTMLGDEVKTVNQTAQLPAKAFKLREDLLGNLKDFLDISIADNGAVTVTPKRPLKAGVKFEVPVQVTYNDGSVETVGAKFEVTQDGKWQADKVKLTYDGITTAAGTPGNTTPKGDKPEGTKFTLLSKLPTGWSASVDERTGELSVTSPRGGVSTEIYVQAVFPDTSTENYTVPFKATALSDAVTASYPEKTVTAGERVTAAPDFGSAAPTGAKFSGPNQDTNGVKISTNENTGEITVETAKNAAGQTLSIPVRVTYSDGTVDVATAKVTIKAAPTTTSGPTVVPTTVATPTTTPTSTTPSTTTPATTTTPVTSTTSAKPTTTQPSTSNPAPIVVDVNWKDTKVERGTTTTVKPEGNFPAGTKFYTGGVNGWDVTIDETTGVLTVKIPADANGGTTAKVNIAVTVPGAKQFTRTVNVTVAAQRDAVDVKYADGTAQQGKAYTAAPAGAPEGTTFKATDGQNFTNWGLEVEEATGKVTVTPKKKDMGPGSKQTFYVTATYPDGTSEITSFVVTLADEKGDTTPVNERDNNTYSPAYPKSTEIYGNQQVTISRTGGVPEGTTFELAQEQSKYWTVSVDKASGAISFKPTQPLKAGPETVVQVKVTYPDKSVEYIAAGVKITEDARFDRDNATVTYQAAQVPADKEIEVTPRRTSVPEGTKYALRGDAPKGWSIDVNETTGAVKVKAPTGTSAGTNVTIPVLVTYPDGSSETATFSLTTSELSDPQNQRVDVKYPQSVQIPAGETITVTPENLPVDAEVRGPNQTAYGFTISTNEDTGVVTIAAVEDIDKDAAVTVPVRVIFSDGTTQDRSFLAAAQPKETTTTPASTTTPATTTPATTTATTTTPETSKPAPRTTTKATLKPTPTETKEPEGTGQPSTSGSAPTITVPDTDAQDGASSASSQSSNGSSLSSEDGTPTTGGIIAIVLGMLAAIAGLFVAAMPVLRDMGILPF